MATPVLMPKQGQSVETCVINEWYKNEGDEVKKGDVLFSYETDKASFEEEAPEDGILLVRFFEDGDEVDVLTNVAVIGKEGESVEAFRPGGSEPEQEEKPTAEEAPQTETTPQTSSQPKPEQPTPQPAASRTGETEGPIKISPRAKRLAEKLKIPFQSIQGSGPYGRIIEADIEQYAKTGPRATSLADTVSKETEMQMPASGTGIGGRIRKEDLTEQPAGTTATEDVETKKISNMRKIIAENMYQSLQNSAQLTHHTTADARAILNLRKQVKANLEKSGAVNITLNDMVCYAVIQALKNTPDMNAHFLGEEIKYFHKVHLGMAVNTDRGLMVPSLQNADDYALNELAVQLRNMADSCQKGNIDPERLSSENASFTVSNLGVYGIEMFTPVLNLPQVGILGVNTITYRPSQLSDGSMGFIPRIGLSLTYDHQAIDGAPASQFLKEVVNQVENIEQA